MFQSLHTGRHQSSPYQNSLQTRKLVNHKSNLTEDQLHSCTTNIRLLTGCIVLQSSSCNSYIHKLGVQDAQQPMKHISLCIQTLKVFSNLSTVISLASPKLYQYKHELYLFRLLHAQVHHLGSLACSVLGWYPKANNFINSTNNFKEIYETTSSFVIELHRQFKGCVESTFQLLIIQPLTKCICFSQSLLTRSQDRVATHTFPQKGIPAAYHIYNRV